ncbi:hypothetical protein K458DRAFT_388318 [Lentithecium fluviatile CBS 122367]|uniref:Ankyrin n=1 Tax=Lentithecium fluviatile CBS 122367 TaxID=1168545 RepID=A0A6G1J5E7_9PLEO|nr:hypothetical protein K458DRAFT_388318 [Lentithecium fluviatile CBS 122367]
MHMFVSRQVALPPGVLHNDFQPGISVAADVVALQGNALEGEPAFARPLARLLSSRQKFGIWRQELVRTKPQQCDIPHGTLLENEDESYEEVYFWTCKILRYGIRWSRQRLYGTVLQSISTFPVVSEFKLEYFSESNGYGNVSDLERAFHEGEVHPLARDRHGRSLFHIAVIFSCGDICRLLGRLGVKPDADFHGAHPLDLGSMRGVYNVSSKTIDIMRFSQDLDFVQSMENARRKFYLEMPAEAIVWVWRNRAQIFFGQNTSDLASVCISSLLYLLRVPNERDSATEYLKGDFASDLRTSLMESTLRFLEHLFVFDYGLYHLTRSFESFQNFKVGEAFVDVIQQLGIDGEAVIRQEMDKYLGETFPTRYFVWPFRELPQRRLVAGFTVRGWRLGWEWIYDQEEAGYLLVSEYSELAAEQLYAKEFPFHGRVWDSVKELESSLRQRRIRFEGRMAVKHRKELARKGQKQPRCRMPGTWID